MTLSTFQLSDDQLDTEIEEQKIGNTNFEIGLAEIMGSTDAGAKRNDTYWATFHVFPLTGIPAGATINGVMLEFTHYRSRPAQTGFGMQIGNLADDGIWSDGGGFGNANYPTDATMPFAEWAGGASSNLAVWIDGLGPAGTLANMPAMTIDTTHSFGDGTGVAPDTTIAGMTAHFQLAFDESGLSDPPVAFHLFRTWAGINNVAYLYLKMNGNSTPAHRPKLYVDWTGIITDSGPPRGVPRSRPAVSSRPSTGAAVLGVSRSRPAVSSRPSTVAAVSATLRTRAAVTGRPRSGGNQ